MATNTTNYGFKKPDESDFYDVQDQNNNWDLADGALKELDTPTFEDYTGDTEVPAAATALESIRSKGKLATLLSNIKAFCKGCITLAMLVNDTATNNSQLPVSSAVTHDLQQQLNVLNTKLIDNLIYRSVTETIAEKIGFNGAYTADVTAPTVDGYRFVVWVGLETTGWVGVGYISAPYIKNTTVYFPPIQTLSENKKIRATALYQKI